MCNLISLYLSWTSIKSLSLIMERGDGEIGELGVYSRGIKVYGYRCFFFKKSLKRACTPFSFFGIRHLHDSSMRMLHECASGKIRPSIFKALRELERLKKSRFFKSRTSSYHVNGAYMWSSQPGSAHASQLTWCPVLRLEPEVGMTELLISDSW